MESAFKKVRLIQWSLLAASLLCAAVAEMAHPGGAGSDWKPQYWLAVGLSAWMLFSGFQLRGRLLKRSQEAIRKNPAKAVRDWEAAHIISLAMAQGIVLWGVVIRMVWNGALLRACLFYATGLFLLLLWTPRRPIQI